MTTTEVIVPLKAFAAAKQRLSIRPEQRVELMKRMASHVLTCTRNFKSSVVCDDKEVATWAKSEGFSVLFQPASGLNEAVQLASEHKFDDGLDRIVVAHGDLPLLTDLEQFVEVDGVVAVLDRARSGTKVLSVPAGHEFVFNYGDRSARAHRAEAQRCNLPFEAVLDTTIGFDINTLKDLDRLAQEHPNTFARLTKNILTNPYEATQGTTR